MSAVSISGPSRPGSPSSVTSKSSNYFDQLENIDPYMPLLDDTDNPEHTTSSFGQPLAATFPTTKPEKRRRLDEASNSTTGRPVKVQKTQSSPSVMRGLAAVASPEERDHSTPYIIAELPEFREETRRLPYGAQWEIARLISAGISRDAFTPEVLLRFRGENATAAPEVARSVGRATAGVSITDDAFAAAFAKEKATQLPWDELDREERILRYDPYGGLGCNSDKEYLQNYPDWYGGRIQFTGKLSLVNRIPTFKVSLNRPVLGASNRFARRFGSRHVLRLQIPEDLRLALQNIPGGDISLLSFFGRPLIVHDWIFRAFYAKEDNVFLYQTSERWDGGTIQKRGSIKCRGIPKELTFYDFLMWHNPMQLNSNQPMVKWVSRFALGLSTSVPGIRLQAERIKEEEDIVCDAFCGEGKIPSEMIMTDGCGFIHRQALRRIEEQLGWTLDTMVVQMRIGGAKGLLLADPRSLCGEETGADVRLRPSQIKIKLSQDSESIDPAMLTVDILRPGRLTGPARLSTETIVNFTENGVPAQAVFQLMRDTMQEKVDRLTTWNDPASVYELWWNVQQAGGVIMERLSREARGAARAKGYTSRDGISHKKGSSSDADEDDDLDSALQERSLAWWKDPISGCPSSLEETVLVLLDSGFTPDACPVLAAKLREVAKKALTNYVEKFHIDVMMSCKAFMVPDPCGVLKPGEIHVRSSSRSLVNQDGEKTDLVLGDVLVTRHPCKVPTDTQKVKAVFHEKLRSYTDVVIVSTEDHFHNGKSLHRHLASMTGGGDFDGDTLEVFWDPTIVSEFKNADPSFAQEPLDVQSVLVQQRETVDEFVQRTTALREERLTWEYQKYLLAALNNSRRVGMYSTWWEASIYEKGYDHPETIFLAYMFTTVLDGSKTGAVVSQDIFSKHQRMYERGPLPWSRLDTKSSSRKQPTRSPGLPPFILERLKEEIDKAKGVQEKLIDERLPYRLSTLRDEDLAKPWFDAMARAAEAMQRHNNENMQQELEAIRTHVEQTYTQHRQMTLRGLRRHASGGGSSTFASARKSSDTPMTSLPIEQRQDMLRELSYKFACGPAGADGTPTALVYFDDASLRRVRASYAYVYDQKTSSKGWSRFPWDVALGTLCEIKAGTLGPTKMVTDDFYARMTLAKSFLK